MTVAEYAEWGMSSDAPDSRDELIDGVIVPLLPHYVMHALANGLIAFDQIAVSLALPAIKIFHLH